MGSYVYMKVLESAPERYDRGIRLLSGGAIDRVYAGVAARAVTAGRRVLDIGCGTGGLAIACAAQGADVVGIDINPGMLEVARTKSTPRPIEWVELGAMEIEDRFGADSFDAVVSCLAFSELSDDEQSYVLRTARSRLRPGGTVVIADEVLPATRGGRLWRRLRRLPVTALTFLLTQTTTRPVEDLARRLSDAGLRRVTEERVAGTSIAIVQGHRTPEAV